MGSLSINMHYKCNAKCIFCVVGIPHKNEKPNMNSDKTYTYEEMEEELIMGRNKGHDGLVLSGGEPTIHPDMFRVCKKAKELGYVNIQVKTNGIKLNDYSFVKEMADSGVDTFCVSIQGPNEDIHDKLVAVPGAFNKIMNGIEHIHSLNKELITPTCIQKDNYQYLPDTIRLFHKIKTSHCTPTFVETDGSVVEYFDKIVPRYSEVIPYLEEAIKLLKEFMIPFYLHGFPMCMIKGYEAISIDLLRIGSSLAGTEIDDYTEYEKQMFRKKELLCKKCTLDPVCSGPWANYVKAYGFDEFVPVISKSITDIIPVQILMNKLFAS
jgi:MoaA/NifB/PqqE/SkfB family radical SAM enzyme